MNKLTVIPSFSDLLSQLKKGTMKVDLLSDPDTICYFGCSFTGIHKTLENKYGKEGTYHDVWDFLSPVLLDAECSGRVLWRSPIDSIDYYIQYEYLKWWLGNHIEIRGGNIGGRLNEVHNIPSLMKYLNSVTNLEIEVIDKEFAWWSQAPNH